MKRILLFGGMGQPKRISCLSFESPIFWKTLRPRDQTERRSLKIRPPLSTLGLETLCCALSRMSSSILPGNFAKLAAEQKTLLNTWMINVDWVVLP